MGHFDEAAALVLSRIILIEKGGWKDLGREGSPISEFRSTKRALVEAAKVDKPSKYALSFKPRE